ncbi:E3 ubiquitin-protein ligase rad18 [Coemansia biformis]|uniref:Postreplication repair E3 ubiquitin-protein ligase RAD18 n=1 Tax=Coemansia biformis TaxID=1286918 RepID=A0A9W7YEW6_9FUNG|nr:E3 ubiquitin-protein ligase rad18 [Coemansia biformis]
MLDGALDDPSDWPAEHTGLRDLDQLLRCPICKEYFTTAMAAASCGHTFCSLCVRRCLTQETKCPSCRAPLTESDLHPSRLIDSLLRAFVGGRQRLLAALSAARPEPTDADCARPGARRNLRSAGAAAHDMPEQRKRPRIRTRSAARTDDGSDSPGSTGDCIDLPSSDTGHGAWAPSQHTDDDSDFAPTEAHIQPSKGPPAVPCPNCQQAVAAARINWHLDRCLAGRPTDGARGGPWGLAHGAATSGGSAPKRQAPLRLQSAAAGHTLPRPTKMAYSLLSEAKLRRTLRDLGIPTKGDKQQMQARHVEWVNMYMANADSDAPVSHRLLLRRLAAWEDALARPADAAKHPPPDSPADHAAKYSDAFASLVAQAQASRKRPAASDA